MSGNCEEGLEEINGEDWTKALYEFAFTKLLGLETDMREMQLPLGKIEIAA